MTLKIQVYSDYVCPFCFLAKGPFEEAIQGKDVEVEWMPFELRPSPAAPIDPWNDPAKLRGWESYIVPTARQWGVDMTLPHVSPHPYTHLAHEGYQYAKERGLGREYNHRVFTAFFQEEQNIGEIDVLTRLAVELGLPEADFREALTTGAYRAVHQKEVTQANEELRITAVPTFIIGEERVQGAVGKAVLDKIITQQLEQQQAETATGLACENGKDFC